MEFLSSSNEKIVPARQLKRSCGPGCRLKCETKLSEERREIILLIFGLYQGSRGNMIILIRYVTEKSLNIEVCKHIEEEEEEEKKEEEKEPERENSKKRKNYSRIYNFHNTRGCKKMLLNTLIISEQMVKTIFNLRNIELRNSVVLLKDNRGSSQPRPRAVDPQKSTSIRDHCIR